MKNVLSVILGGGRGSRLYPLTKYRAKPAVPLAGKYRIIDIPISNCLNSGFKKIVILTQFNSESLNKHIFRAYKFDFFSGGFVEILAADQSLEHADWFQGSADAVRKSLRHFNDPRIEYILILSGDQLYKMDFGDLLKFHKKNKSDVTIACNAVSQNEVYGLGIMSVDKNHRIVDFVEKPAKDDPIDHLAVTIDGKRRFLASMGIYVFNKEVLVDLLMNSHDKVDFGKEIIPEALPHKVTHAYVYQGYWKDIGSVESFYAENIAFTEPIPPLNLYDEEWPFFTRPRYLPLSKIAYSTIENSTIAEGVIIDKVKISRSIVGLRSRVGQGSIIEDSILMGNDYYEHVDEIARIQKQGEKIVLGIGKNCHIKKAIVDKNVRIGDNVKIINAANRQDFENDYCVIRNGIIVVPKGTIIPPNTVI